eukprot:tig00021603_g22820.t2
MAVAPLAHGVLRQAHVIQAALQVAGEGAAAGQEDHAPAPLEGWLQMTSTWAAPGSSGPNVEARRFECDQERREGHVERHGLGRLPLLLHLDTGDCSVGLDCNVLNAAGVIQADLRGSGTDRIPSKPPSCGALRPCATPCADPCVGPCRT